MKRFIEICCAVAIISVFSSAAFAADICSKAVDTKEGPAQGMSEERRQACVWKGIPYAAPPVGELRWKAPIPTARRSAPYKAHKFSAECPQVEMLPGFLRMVNKKPVRNEDCLYLNIWRPKKEGRFPVMFWIHGGGLVSGTGSAPMYWGDRLVAEKDVVLVTFNYRLAAFGFMAHPELSAEDPHGSSGNYGLLDQVAALKWVNENIAGFGGDPNNITIFGESAGGWSVCFHLASPLSKGLFQKAIIESGGCEAVNTVEEGFKNGGDFTSELGCSGEKQLDCMRSKSADEIAEALGKFGGPKEEMMKLENWKHRWVPHIDNYTFKESPIDSLRSGEYNRVPLLAGSNRDEFKLFVAMTGLRRAKLDKVIDAVADSLGWTMVHAFISLYPFDRYKRPADAIIDAKGDIGLGCKTYEAVRASSKYRPTYYYRFDYDEHRFPNALGAAHGTEIPFVFDAIDRPIVNYLYNGKQRKKARPLVDVIMGYWTEFARTGNPSSGGAKQWPPYDENEKFRMYLDLPLSVNATDNVRKCEFWKEAGLVR